MKKFTKFICILIALILTSSLSPEGFISAESAFTPTTEPSARIGTNFWFMGESYKEKPFIDNIKWATAYEEGIDVWNPVFIDEIMPYTHLRFMDWGSTNNSDVVSWETRRLPTSSGNKSVGYGKNTGVAYEWMIDLCNRTGKDIWLCVPHKADDNYITKLAELVKEKLNPDLNCYIEYSNETWNSNFEQHAYANQKGAELGLPGDSPSMIGASYNILRSVQIFDMFANVFGDEMKNRVTRICSISGALRNFSFSYRNIAYDYTCNPNRQFADVLCIAPYVGEGLDGKSPTVFQDFNSATDQKYTGYILEAKTMAEDFGLRLGTYEGGQHLLTNADVFSSSPEVYDCYAYMLEKFLPELGFFTHYAHCGKPSSGGAWGAKHYTGQPMEEAHRYRALVDYINTHPVHKQPITLPPVEEPEFEFKHITDRTADIKGYTEGNAEVSMTIKGVATTVVSDIYGNFSFNDLKLAGYKDKTAITFEVKAMRRHSMECSTAKKFKLTILPDNVKISAKKITKRTAKIKGRCSPKSQIRILVKNKKYKTFKADKKGKFNVKVNFKKYSAKTPVKIYSFRKIGKTELKTKVLKYKLSK